MAMRRGPAAGCEGAMALQEYQPRITADVPGPKIQDTEEEARAFTRAAMAR